MTTTTSMKKEYDIPKYQQFGQRIIYITQERKGVKKAMRMEDKLSPALEDTDLMEFGKYVNRPMSDVPASYLKWLWEEAGIRGYKNGAIGRDSKANFKVKLANYIWNCKDHLAGELGEKFI